MRFRLEGWDPAPAGAGDDVAFSARTSLDAPCDGELVFDGLATLCSVLVDGVEVATSESMWVPVRVPVSAGAHEVEVRVEPLTPRLAERRTPRARWRQKVAYDGNLRWFRTTLLGRAPGFAPGPPVVGLWRPAWFVAHEPQLTLRTRADGTITAAADRDGTLACDGVDVALSAGVAGELRIADPELWWPHTHGSPRLYDVTFTPTTTSRGSAAANGGVLKRRVGFRSLSAPDDWLRDGLALRVNDLDIFVRGALWTPVPEGEERATLEAARDAGLNAIRLPGTGVYESRAFHDLCDEFGLLVWQDLMLANLDYPFEALDLDPELDALADAIGGRPSLAVVCGGSEMQQQVAMLGLDPAIGRPPDALFERLDVDAVRVPNAPCGVDRPLRPDDGVANWFGVGGYRQPLAAARAAGVRFAGECLALANVGADGDTTGAMRDVDSPWDFMDVTRHYLDELYGAEAGDELLPYVGGDVMSEVFGEWRRAASPTRGAFILWLRDLAAGAGWGLLDHAGRPKAALASLSRVLQPVAVWMTDEGLGGYAIHIANDRPEPLAGDLRLTVYRDGEHVIEEATTPVEIGPHGSWTMDAETLLDRWIDISYAYRFGPPGHDLVVAALGTIAAAREPVRSAARFTADALGLEVRDRVLTTRRALVDARVGAEMFTLEPGRERHLPTSGVLEARNLVGSVEL